MIDHPLDNRGSLTVVGTGMQGASQTTLETIACVEQADVVYYSITDAVTEYWLRGLNRNVVSFAALYGDAKSRAETYAQMIDALVSAVKAGSRVCAVFYGHPGVLVYASHQAIALLKAEGYSARMFPAISADSCLYSDLGIDPGDVGTQSFEATDFLLSRRLFDPTSVLILWQVGVLGERTGRRGFCRPGRVRRLVESLSQHYPKDHVTVLYYAATFPGNLPTVQRIPLIELPSTDIAPLAMLYVPPLPQRPPAPDILEWLEQD